VGFRLGLRVIVQVLEYLEPYLYYTLLRPGQWAGTIKERCYMPILDFTSYL
jgi:hypothetical protein